MSGQTPKQIWLNWYADAGITTFALYGSLNGQCRCQLGAMCKNPSKHPKRRDWFELKESYISELDNVGVNTHNLVIIDIDRQDIPLDQFAPTFTTETGKGFHLWYWANPNVSIAPKVGWKPHIDIRAVGSLIVAPPSKHITGKIYSPVNDLEIKMIPDELLEILPHKIEQQKLGHQINLNTKTTSSLILPVLESICLKVLNAPQGQRNQELFRQFCQVLRYVDDEMMGSDAIQSVADAAEQNGLTESEIRVTLASAIKSL